ncbi:MAG: epoxyqueuosine reductase QueH [Candidatus Gracilibacteria bacterium]|nr:epoxyqueuosine reductase QueH [Candidatus Gracilibacteria bacterium]
MLKKYKIGIDEAGRGPWLGPVVACSMTFNPDNLPDKIFLDTINDSKKLTEKKRDEIFHKLIELSTGVNPQVFFGVGVVDNFLIDEINIKKANKEAMRRSLLELLRKINKEEIGSVLVDGNDNYIFEELEKKPIYVIGGDAKILEIGRASIIAKVFRDNLINTYSLIYPDLNLKNHKGYGKKKHSDYLVDKTKVTGIHRLSYKPIKKIIEKKEKLLLHVCCGPDATIPLVDFKQKYDITCFWYDPNIHPKEEYDKRLEAFRQVCEIENIPFIEGEYDTKTFFDAVKGVEKTPEKGEKCNKCYDFRMEKTAKLAKDLEIENFTTTLTISPHKDINKIFIIGQNLSNKYKLKFLDFDFKKNNGFLRSIDYCKLNNIYRQNYCGCVYSDNYPLKK